MPPSTRSATRAANKTTLQTQIELHEARPNINIQEFDIKILVESIDGVQTPLTGPKLSELQKLFNTLYTHLTSGCALSYLSQIILDISDNAQASEQYRVKFGQVPTFGNIQRQIVEYLKMSPPKVIFSNLDRDKPEGFVWGMVWKGGEKRWNNEMFLSEKLLDVVLGTPPSTLSAKQTLLLQEFHRFSLSTTFIHESTHCLTKHLFPGLKTTPLLSESAKDLETGQGGSGTSFEFSYFKFIFELALERSATGHKLWQEKAQIIARLEDKTSFVLDIGTLQLLNTSFCKGKIWNIRHSLPTLTNYKSSVGCARYRITSAMGDHPEEKGAEAETTTDGLGIEGLELHPWRCGRTYG